MIAAFNQLKSQLTRNEKRVLYTAFFVLVACILISFITPVYWQKILDNTHWTVTSGAAAWLTWYAYSKASIQNKPIKYWFFIAYACYFMGDLLWDIQSATKWQTFPSPSDLLYPLLGIGFIIGFLHALKTHLSRAKYIAA